MLPLFMRKHEKENAQGLVEFALILPLLLLVVLGAWSKQAVDQVLQEKDRLNLRQLLRHFVHHTI